MVFSTLLCLHATSQQGGLPICCCWCGDWWTESGKVEWRFWLQIWAGMKRGVNWRFWVFSKVDLSYTLYLVATSQQEGFFEVLFHAVAVEIDEPNQVGWTYPLRMHSLAAACIRFFLLPKVTHGIWWSSDHAHLYFRIGWGRHVDSGTDIFQQLEITYSAKCWIDIVAVVVVFQIKVTMLQEIQLGLFLSKSCSWHKNF